MGLGGLISGIMGAADLGPKIGTPNPSTVGQDYRGLVQGYTGAMPQIFQSEAQFQPQYAQLGLGTAYNTMFGGGQVPGLAQQFGQMVPYMTAANTLGRLGQVGDVASIGGAAAGALAGLNPAAGNLLGTLTNQTGTQLGYDNRLDPAQQRMVQQSVRAGQAARGMGYGPADVYGETMGMTTYGDTLRQQRQAAATQALGLNQQMINVPALSMLTGTSDAAGLGQSMLGAGLNMAQNVGPKLMPSNLTYDMFNTAYNAQAAALLGNANNRTALMQGFNSFT